MSDPGPGISSTALRRAEKYFKSRSAAPSGPGLTHKQQKLARKHIGKPSLRGRGVVDLSRSLGGDDVEVVRAGWEVEADPYGGRSIRSFGLRGPVQGERAAQGYILAEGVVLIPNHLDKDAQLALLCEALASYPRPPNPLSLDTHYAMPKQDSGHSLFRMYAEGSDVCIPSYADLRRAEQEDTTEKRTMARSRASAASTAAPSPRQLVNNPSAVQEGLEAIQRRVAEWQGDEPSPRLGGATAVELMRELRWCNLGHVYNWTNKAYDFTCKEPISFPPELAATCSQIVGSIPWDRVFDHMSFSEEQDRPDYGRWADDYAPDTGIVNYYQLRDTLMGHVDRSELDPYRPLVSISLGHGAIFLLGGEDRDVEPIPVILRSGDVIVMAGRGRQLYHGVPRIMEGTLPDHFLPVADDDAAMAACKRFISTARININARQVFPAGKTPLAGPASVSTRAKQHTLE